MTPGNLPRIARMIFVKMGQDDPVEGFVFHPFANRPSGAGRARVDQQAAHVIQAKSRGIPVTAVPPFERVNIVDHAGFNLNFRHRDHRID